MNESGTCISTQYEHNCFKLSDSLGRIFTDSIKVVLVTFNLHILNVVSHLNNYFVIKL